MRTEELESGQVREYRTRRQLWEYADSSPRAGTAGRRPAKGPDPRLALAVEALAAEPGRKPGDIAATLAERHGGGLSTWKRIVTQWPVVRPGRPADEPAAPSGSGHDEAAIRRIGRGPGMVFHADALNSPFFQDVPLDKRFAAIVRVVDLLLRKPSKGRVSVGEKAITVTGNKVTLTLTPDCRMVRTLKPADA
ncbi:hypothetical protein [Streptomyces sp. NPDC049915]|uniref:hypothetical protein n=1 Tax=Streptomyces sp. NPDC049915 TaxID=3155510 RepID=UPI0034497138